MKKVISVLTLVIVLSAVPVPNSYAVDRKIRGKLYLSAVLLTLAGLNIYLVHSDSDDEVATKNLHHRRGKPGFTSNFENGSDRFTTEFYGIQRHIFRSDFLMESLLCEHEK